MNLGVRSAIIVVLAATAGAAQTATQTAAAPAEATIRPIPAARNPLPAEAQSAGVSKFSFIAYGDTRAARQEGPETQYEHGLVVDAMVAAIKRLESTPYPVKFVLQSGDAVLRGADTRRWNEGFTGHIARITQEAGLPYFFSVGNHDVSSAQDVNAPERQAGLRNTLAAIANIIPPEGSPRRMKGYPTYGFGYGNVFCIALDSNIAADEAQYNWVKAQLEGLDRKRYVHVIAFFHHPPFSSGPHGGARVEPQAQAMRTRYLPLFRKHHVEMTIAGHEHLYEHWVERYEEAGRKYRRDDLVSGGGGAPLYPHSGEPNLSDYLREGAAEKLAVEHLVRPGAERGDNPYHFVIVRVDGDRLDLEVVGVGWGSGYQPYRSRRVELKDSAGR